MQTVVVYESAFGRTRAIAEAIGAGLADRFEVAVVSFADADLAQIRDADLVVVGGPTHMQEMRRTSARQGAVTQADADTSPTLEAPAGTDGLLKWLAALGAPQPHSYAAAFDTRRQGMTAFADRASKGITRALRHQGFEMIEEPKSFFLTATNELWPGAEAHARGWGHALTQSWSMAVEAAGSNRLNA